MGLKIGIGQCNLECGQLQANLSNMQKMIQQAKDENADLIVFPENCVSGSFAGDKFYSKEWIKEVEAYNDWFIQQSQEIGIVWGNLSTEDEKLYNSVYLAYENQLVYTQKKTILANLGVVNEQRYFSVPSEQKAELVEFKGNKLSFVFGNELLENKVIDSDVLICLDQRVWTMEEECLIDSKIKELKLNKVVYVNVAGMQNIGKNVVLFDGNSGYYLNGVKTCTLNDGFKEELMIVDNDSSFNHKVNHKLLTALIRAIQEFDRQVLPYKPQWIIGLSGGLDSSVNAALLSMALGSERICAYNLATKYNSTNTKDNATNLADALGIKLRNGAISEVVEATVNTMYGYKYEDKDMPTLVHENIQARVRGHLLSTFAQIENGVVINNGNKIETALGYATLYGDAIGALSSLADLTKVQLFDLSHQINDYFKKEVIPERLLPNVIDDKIEWLMPPSAELKDAQFDPMKWFYHDWLISELTDKKVDVEDIMECYLDGSLLNSEMGKWLRYYHLDNPKAFIDDLEWVLRQMKVAVFKRLQAPPIVMVSKNAFGNNRVEVQGSFDNSKRYQELKDKILNK